MGIPNGQLAASTAAPRERAPVPGTAPWLSRERLLILGLLAITVLVFYLCFLLTAPFLPSLAWAVALAVVARPLHEWMSRRVGSPDLAALLTVLLVTVILVAPALFVFRQLVHEVGVNADNVKERVTDGKWRGVMERYPDLKPVLEWVEANVDAEREGRRAVELIFGNVASVLSGSFWILLQGLLTLYVLFFFFRDRRQVVGAVRRLVPLSETETSDVFKRVSETIHATINGALFVAVIQGTLGGLMFWFLGLPAPVLWGAVMSLLAVIPFLGTFVIWAPTAAFLALDGDWGRALILAGWGLIVVASIDNLLYPLLVGKRMRLHTLVAFFGVVGGIGLYGAAGIVLGPVTIAIAIALVEVWRRRTANGQSSEAALKEKHVLTA